MTTDEKEKEMKNTNDADVETKAETNSTDAADADDVKNAEVTDGTENKLDENKLNEKIEELKDKFLRKVAEFDNFKKRTAREKTENFALGLCGAVEKLLPVLDNLDRAISSAETNDDKEALLEGIKMIRNQFSEALTAIGVSEIEAVGKDFDPEKHNAVMAEESEEPSNTVIDEFAKGYVYKSGDSERVIRHSMVKVST